MRESRTPSRSQSNPRQATVALCGGVVLLSILAALPRAQDAGRVREVRIVADNFAFAPARIEVRQNDIVRITFRAADIPHSFTIDDYRIAKRAGVAQTIAFEFRAERAGTFPIYCSLQADERCKRMKGDLVVQP
jgi:heme/copper-type cytochrome/quinol oxidase subunit 2